MVRSRGVRLLDSCPHPSVGDAARAHGQQQSWELVFCCFGHQKQIKMPSVAGRRPCRGVQYQKKDRKEKKKKTLHRRRLLPERIWGMLREWEDIVNGMGWPGKGRGGVLKRCIGTGHILPFRLAPYEWVGLLVYKVLCCQRTSPATVPSSPAAATLWSTRQGPQESNLSGPDMPWAAG